MLSLENDVGVWAGNGRSSGNSASYSSWKFYDGSGLEQCTSYEKDCSTGEGKTCFSTIAAIIGSFCNICIILFHLFYIIILAAGYRSDCDDLAAKTAIYDAAPDTCPALDYTCINKAAALILKHNASTA